MTARASDALLRKSVGYLLLPLLSAVTPLLLLPVVARQVDSVDWAAIAVGQSVGGVAGILITFGWLLVGPAQVAREQSHSGRVQLYADSLTSRSVVMATSLGPIVVLSMVLTPSGGNVGYAVSIALASATYGLSATWFNIGEGRPTDIALYDAVPRLLGASLAAWWIAASGFVYAYPILQSISVIAGVTIFSWKTLRSSVVQVSVRRTLAALRRAAGPMFTDVAANSYSAAAVALVGVAGSVAAVSEYASADKLYKLGLFAVAALGNALLPWVAASAELVARRRLRLSLGLFAGLGVAAILGFLLLGPWTTKLLFGADLAAGRTTCALLGVAFLGVAINSYLGRLVLIPAGHYKWVLFSTLCGAAVGVPLFLTLSATAGASGASLALAVSELVVCAVQVPIGIRLYRQQGRFDLQGGVVCSS